MFALQFLLFVLFFGFLKIKIDKQWRQTSHVQTNPPVEHVSVLCT